MAWGSPPKTNMDTILEAQNDAISEAGDTFSRWWFQIFFYFHPYLGKIPILTDIFQRGWNHQVAIIFCYVRFRGGVVFVDVVRLLPEESDVFPSEKLVQCCEMVAFQILEASQESENLEAGVELLENGWLIRFLLGCFEIKGILATLPPRNKGLIRPY